jgi:hypothetical protein
MVSWKTAKRPSNSTQSSPIQCEDKNDAHSRQPQETPIDDVCEQHGAGSTDFAYYRILQIATIGRSGSRRGRRVLLPPLDHLARNTCSRAPRPADGV